MAKSFGSAEQKDFVKLLNSLTGAYSPWEVWQDMVWIFADALANGIPFGPHRQKREDDYLKRIGKYDSKKQKAFPELFAMLVQTIEKAVTVGRYGDFLGELFMQMNLGNNLGGQFFTPYHVCEAMSKVAFNDAIKAEIDERGYITVNDPACGAGATLISFAQVLREHGYNYQQCCIFTGQDIDYTTSLMCYIQLSLLGCAGYVHVGNTLSAPDTSHPLFGGDDADTWKTPVFYTDRWEVERIRYRHPEWGREAAVEEASSVDTAEPASPIEPPEGIFTIGTGKNEGQIMLDLGL